MPIIRKNLITNDWVIFSPEREKRPRELGNGEEDNVRILAARPRYKESCPFCPGNEAPDNAEILRIGPTDGWRVRIIENKFSAVDRHATPTHPVHPLRKEIEGFGIHDVIIDNPRHNATLGLMDQAELRDLVAGYLERYRQLQADERVRHVVVFKNQGIKAGGSLEHPHSQIYGLPVMPFETSIRVREVEKYHHFNDRCLLCDILADEKEQKVRLVAENDTFVSFAPWADLSPYHIWIAPKRHSPCFGLLGPREEDGLADMIGNVFGRIFRLLRNPDYNFVIQSLSRHEREQEFFHWYLSVIPHMKAKGGISYAGGLYSNAILPEIAAAELRGVDLDAPIEGFAEGTEPGSPRD
jgi:UDPglucose--hexose-1-phosphate uridylyltransferase